MMPLNRPPGMHLLIVGLAFAVGCQGDGIRLVPIQGTVTIKGKPLDNATIQFTPTPGVQSPGGVGISDGNGSFTVIGSRMGGKGLVPGEYRVSVLRAVGADGLPLTNDVSGHVSQDSYESIPRRYTTPETSPLTAVVPPQGGPLSIDIPEDLVRRK